MTSCAVFLVDLLAGLNLVLRRRIRGGADRQEISYALMALVVLRQLAS